MSEIGPWADPAKALIERVSDAIGGMLVPWQIERTAKAEANAKIISAKAELEVSSLRDRAERRKYHEAIIDQKNIESVVVRSLVYLNEDARPEKIHDDWIRIFLSKCKMYSDEDMQDLWSRILAGEANIASSFSRKTINLVSLLDEIEARYFAALCDFSIKVDYGKGVYFPFVNSFDENIHLNAGLSFSVLKNLESLGLVHLSQVGGFREGLGKNELEFEYFEEKIKYNTTKEKYFDAGIVKFSSVGLELRRVCDVGPVNGFVDYFKENFEKINPSLKLVDL
ncbi:DUF2806 domain-containing protein [Thalassospira sp. SN3W]|uniref:DUF2806 domain-containing protein n=1 Tax=Thalassospira sp. SN3W TaxID=3035476 RepID=UPI00311ADCEC